MLRPADARLSREEYHTAFVFNDTSQAELTFLQTAPLTRRFLTALLYNEVKRRLGGSLGTISNDDNPADRGSGEIAPAGLSRGEAPGL